jgi:DNA-directed RNA polymerase subunit H (RpoH/RPB5)
MEAKESNHEEDACPVLPLKQQCYTIKTIDKIINTVREMFEDRGYMISPKSKWPERVNQMEDLKIVAQVGQQNKQQESNLTPIISLPKLSNTQKIDDIDKEHDKEQHNNNININMVENNLDDNVKIGNIHQKTGILFSSLVYVYFAIDPKVPVKKMREYIQHMIESKVNHAIIVYAQQITPSAKNEIPPNLDIETFKANELFENVTKHKLVPPHYKLDESEVNELLKLRKTTRKKLPRYNPEDPIVKYYHWPIGSVIKIIRKFGNQQDPQIYWRHVRVCP